MWKCPDCVLGDACELGTNRCAVAVGTWTAGPEGPGATRRLLLRESVAENLAAGLHHGGEGLPPPLQAAHHRRLQSGSCFSFTVLTSFPNLLQRFPQCSWPVCLFAASRRRALEALCGLGCARSAICFYERRRQRGIMGWMFRDHGCPVASRSSHSFPLCCVCPPSDVGKSSLLLRFADNSFSGEQPRAPAAKTPPRLSGTFRNTRWGHQQLREPSSGSSASLHAEARFGVFHKWKHRFPFSSNLWKANWRDGEEALLSVPSETLLSVPHRELPGSQAVPSTL